MTEVPRCGQCRHWAPILKERGFGRCIAPERPIERCTDKHDTCVRFEAPASGNIVRGEKIEGFLE